MCLRAAETRRLVTRQGVRPKERGHRGGNGEPAASEGDIYAVLLGLDGASAIRCQLDEEIRGLTAARAKPGRARRRRSVAVVAVVAAGRLEVLRPRGYHRGDRSTL